MSALRLGRLPDGTRDIRVLVSYSRLGIRGGGPPTVSGSHVTGIARKTTTDYQREARARVVK